MERILHTIAGSFYSALAYIAVLFVTILTPYRDMFIFIFILSLLDFTLAIVNALFGKNLESRKMTKLFVKLFCYMILFLVIAITKQIYNIDFLEWAFIPIMVMREVLSILGNLALMFPRFVTVKILRDILEKEIEIKMNNNIKKDETDAEETVQEEQLHDR